MKNKNLNQPPLLSICIPTYNRAKFLNESLFRFQREFVNLDFNVELLVSDNHSSDETQEVVHKYIQEGLKIEYIRNEKNSGADLNFVQCFQRAKGKYIWLIGDDDYIKEGFLSKLLVCLGKGTYGLVHLKCNSRNSEFQYKECTEAESLFIQINYFITFISANIFNSKYVSEINYEQYIGTNFIQMPYYITSALSEKNNLIIDCTILDCAADKNSNGGYNYFEVFVSNYLSIWKSFLEKKRLSRGTYEKLKYSVFRKFHLDRINRFLFKKDIGQFKVDHAWSILRKWYGWYPYFYILVLLVFFKSTLRKQVK